MRIRQLIHMRSVLMVV